MIEVVVVLVIMSPLGGLAAFAVTGFLSGGKEKAYEAERETLQLAMDTWRVTTGKTTGPLFPILGSGDDVSCLGTVDATGDLLVAGCNPYLDIKALADTELLKSAAAIKSADTSKNTTGTNKPNKTYGWFVSTGGLVDSRPTFIPGRFP